MKKFFTLILFAFCLVDLYAQTLTTDSSLSKFKNDYPQEKVFIQTDKSNYFPGETIWMKAWCTVDGVPSYLSRILYVDLVNSKGDVVSKKMYKLDSLSSTPVDIDIPSTMQAGNYAINAYTLWMLNFPEFIYRKNVFVYNTDYKINSKNASPVIKINFFPEGGDLVQGLKNRIAFKVTDEKGLPVSIKAFVSDNTTKKLQDITSEHDGMGSFELEIEPGKEYTFNIPSANGSTLQFPLPKAKAEGIVLRVENSNPNKVFVLINKPEQLKERYGKIKVVVQQNYELVLEANLNLDEGQNAFPINKKNLPPGLLHITAFDEMMNPLAERLAFIENYTIAKPQLTLDTLNLKARAKNTISFSLPDIKRASLAVSVSNANLDNKVNEESNIASTFLLTSDLKGYINNPGYYFKDKNPETLRHLDLLLMTQGWRRFEWKKLMKSDYATLNYPVESGIWLTGKVTKSDRNEVVKDGKVSFVIKGEDSTSILAEATLTDKGEFLVNDINYKKKATIAYQGTNNKKENLIVDVHLKPSYIDSLKKSVNRPTVDLDTTDLTNRQNALANYLYANYSKIDTGAFGSGYLGNITVKAKRISKEDSLNAEYATGLFMMGKGINPDDYKHYSTPWQMLQASTPGIRVEGSPFDPNVYFTRFQGLDILSSNNSNSAALGESSAGEAVGLVLEENGIAYFLNEVNVSKDIINTLSVSDIALIKVLKLEANVLGASQGAIAFYTKKGTSAGATPYEKSFTKVERQGYAITRQFYTPDLSLIPQGSDNCMTLYWNSHIKQGKDGKYRFQFLNNDSAKEFKITIQGIDKDGRLIYTEQLIK